MLQSLLVALVLFSSLFSVFGTAVFTTGEHCISPSCISGLEMHEISTLVQTEPCKNTLPTSPLFIKNTYCGFDTSQLDTGGQAHVFCKFTIEHTVQSDNTTFMAMGKLYNSVQTDKYRIGKGNFPLYKFNITKNTPSPISYEVQGYVPAAYWKYDSFRLKLKLGKKQNAACMKFKKAWVPSEYNSGGSSTGAAQQRDNVKAASAGTSLETVTVVPAKGDSTSRRRLTDSSGAFDTFERLTQLMTPDSRLNGRNLRRVKMQDTTANDPTSFSLISDYMTQPDPVYSVRDPSVEVAATVNTISCYISQLRGKDIGVNLEEGSPNPSKLPYVALVDSSICEEAGDNQGSSFQEWIVQATGPAGGDGIYETQFMFEFQPGFPLHGQITNTVSGGRAVKSQLSYNAGGGYMMGGILTDRTDPTSTKIKYLEQTMQQVGSQHLSTKRLKKSRSLAPGSKYAQPTSHIVLKTKAQKLKALQSKSAKTLVKSKKSKSELRKEDQMITRRLQSYHEIYLSVAFNPTEGLTGQFGEAVTNNGNVEYKVAFSDSAILRMDDSNNGACVDYRPSEGLSIGLDYVLFNANDGSRSLFSSGTVIEKEDGDNTYEAYISNWGAYIFYEYDESTGQPVAQPTWLVEGAAVNKMGYSSSGDEAHTLHVAPGRLTNVKNLKVALKDIKDVPLSVRKGSTVDIKIAWDGTSLKTVETLVTQCVQYDDSWESYSIVATNPVDDILCYCYENDGSTARTSGNFNWEARLDRNVKRTVLSSPATFTPTVEEYSDGIEIQTDALWGKLNLKYEKIQKLYMWPPGTYTAGKTVTQASTGATGTVYTTTATVVKGFTCASYACMTYDSNWIQDCSGYSSDAGTWHGLPAGAILKQSGAGVEATVLSDAWSLDWDGISVEFTTGSAFDFTQDIAVSYPTGDVPSGSHLSHYSDITGTLSKPSGTIELNPYDVYVTQGVGCDSNEYVDGIAVKNGPTNAISGANIALWFNDNGEAHGWFNDPASGQTCDPDTVNVLAADITSALSGASITCTTEPTIQVLCTVSQTALSNQLVVQLDEGSAGFAYNHNWPPAENTKLVVDGTTLPNPPGWVEGMSGAVQPVTEDTTVTFRIEKTVNPGSTVPELLCYENCPDPESQSGANMDSCEEYGQSNDCYYPRPTILGDRAERNSEGDCTSSNNALVAAGTLPTGAFTGITGATATITWDMSDDSNSNYKYTPEVEITNRGYGCSTSTAPTFTLTDSGGVCGGGAMAEFNLRCEEGQDTTDYAQARLYTFNAGTGALTEKSSGLSAAIGTSNSNYYSSSGNYKSPAHFGPFVPNVAADKDLLKCDWNENLVCIWQAFEALDNLYFYQSGEQGRRFTLTASDGKTVSFQSALNLIYTHSGTMSNSGKSYDNAKSLLSYEGPGRLTGLPTFCLNPNTGSLATECVPEGHATSTKNGFDINIDPTSVLEDSDGNKYYAKAQYVEEIYPVVGDETHVNCNGLTLPDGSGVAKPALADVYIAPGHLGQSFPTASELKSGDYLDDGEPAVIAGATLKELREAAIALEAA